MKNLLSLLLVTSTLYGVSAPLVKAQANIDIKPCPTKFGPNEYCEDHRWSLDLNKIPEEEWALQWVGVANGFVESDGVSDGYKDFKTFFVLTVGHIFRSAFL